MINLPVWSGEPRVNPDLSRLSAVFHRDGEVAPKVCWRFCG